MAPDAVDDLLRASRRALAVMEAHQTPRTSGDYQEALTQLRQACERASAPGTAQPTSSPGVRFMIYLFCILVGLAMPLFFAQQMGAGGAWFAWVLALVGAGLGALLAREVLRAERS